MLLPIGCNALLRLLAGNGHHAKARFLAMAEIIVIELWQFTLTIRTACMEKHDDRLALQSLTIK